MGGALCAALRVSASVAPPAAPPRAPGWRDRRRAGRARRRSVEIAGEVTIGRGVRFDVAVGARLVLGAGVVLGDGCRFHVVAGEVRVGAGTILGERCVVTAHAAVAIGARCVLADGVVLIDLDHRFDDVEAPVRLQGVRTAPVVLGDGVRIGPGAAVLRGVVVGAGAQVGAHAVVTRDVAPGARVEGVPAAVVSPVVAGPGRAGARRRARRGPA
jgi:acetyltransferase-like isoleucine patch superfamily enzyme